MPNGAVVALSELDSPTTAEVEIGEAAAAAAIAIGLAVADFMAHGHLEATSKIAGGESLARVAQLQLAFFGDDSEFAAIAYREGERALWRHLGFREHATGLEPATRDHMFGEFLQGVIKIAARVVADERALAQH
jgi:hypothetical protein